MSMDDTTPATIAREFLNNNSRYRDLALAVEEAVESLRRDAVATLEKELNLGIAELCHQHSRWRVTAAPPKSAKIYPDFLRRLYRSDGAAKWDGASPGIRIGRWGSHRIKIEVCVEGWPPGDSSAVGRRLANAFDGFVGNSKDRDLWRPDEVNNTTSRCIRYWFDGDTPCLTGNAELKAREIVKLLENLMVAVDGETGAH